MAMLRVMMREASTLVYQRTTPVRAFAGSGREELSRVGVRAVVVGLVIIVVAAAGLLGYFGLNPPNPTPKPVEKTLPNDKFQGR
jgi:hypothetical protein